jgi:hypothetical protein
LFGEGDDEAFGAAEVGEAVGGFVLHLADEFTAVGEQAGHGGVEVVVRVGWGELIGVLENVLPVLLCNGLPHLRSGDLAIGMTRLLRPGRPSSY